MNTNLKLTFLADTHHYSKTLGITGKAYELRSGSDQKCLAETGAIIDSAFEKIANSDTDAVLIAGDLSNDGELVCHKEFREKLYKLQESKPVYVIYATHDWCCDGNPRRFDGDKASNDVETISHENLRDFYRDFGPDRAFDEFTTHLGTTSYAVNLNEHVVLLGLNDDQNGRGGSGFSEDHFKWIEKTVADAKAQGKLVISMQHHLLIAHIHKLITGGGTSVQDNEAVANRMADAGIRYSFVGHSHMLDTAKITSPAGNTLTEVNIGSLCGYPAPIVNVTVNNDDTLTVDVDYLDSFTYNNQITDAQQYLKDHLCAMVDRILEGAAYGDKQTFIERFDAMQLKGEKLVKFRIPIKLVAKFLLNGKAKTACRLVNLITLGKAVDKKAIKSLGNKKTVDFIHEVLLSVFDGARYRHSPDSDYYKAVTGVIRTPSILVKDNKILKQINEIIHILVAGTDLNIYPAVI